MKKTFLKKLAVLTALASSTAASFAGTVAQDDAFYEYANSVKSWVGGGLGVGLATTMLLMGGAIGVAKNSPMPALSGVAGAAFLHWGPEIISQIMLQGLIV